MTQIFFFSSSCVCVCVSYWRLSPGLTHARLALRHWAISTALVLFLLWNKFSLTCSGSPQTYFSASASGVPGSKHLYHCTQKDQIFFLVEKWFSFKTNNLVFFPRSPKNFFLFLKTQVTLPEYGSVSYCCGSVFPGNV